ncbi:MAG: hypothetical protein VKO39_03365 [Cyanobacteriota bacterium]|nr:hypothetical protein [Cyanobacteriota bacterium]
MTRAITIALQVLHRGRRDVQITPRWAGNGLAIHKAIFLDGNDQPHFVKNARGIWVLTHVPTGLGAGMFHGNLQRAIAFAREWDKAFAAVTTATVPQVLRRNYLEALCLAQDGPTEADMLEAGV